MADGDAYTKLKSSNALGGAEVRTHRLVSALKLLRSGMVVRLAL